MPATLQTLPCKPLLLAAFAAAVLTLVGLFSPPSASAAKPKTYECQHPFVTGLEAINPKGVSPKEACKVVRSLAKFEEKDANIEELYECRGASNSNPGRPVLKLHEFEGWKLKLPKSFGLVMYKPGASFRVAGQDFPINCS